MTAPPYQPGDVLALTGPSVGLHLFVAEVPPHNVNGCWYMGYRKWEYKADGCTLRHATKADAERLLELRRAELQRAAESVARVEELAKRIKGARDA